MSLDDYTTDQLQEEIDRRNELMRHGRCPYCKTPIGSERHGCKWATQLSGYHLIRKEDVKNASR